MLGHVKSANVIDFILNLRNRIRTFLEIMNEMEEKVKKVWYDRKARDASYDIGDQVLLLLPLAGKSLQAKYIVPYIVEKMLGEIDYVICSLPLIEENLAALSMLILCERLYH